jgi:hypothetical protein
MQESVAGGNEARAGGPLVSELADVRRQLEAVNEDARDLIAGLSDDQFNWRPEASQWSIAECLDHLSVTNRELMKAMRDGIGRARSQGLLGPGPFRHGWLGNFFVRSMEPPAKRKFKAPGKFSPRPGMTLDEVAGGFFATQDEAAGLIESANGVHLARVKIVSPVSRWVKYSLGQAFALLAAHERRHLWQARQVRNHPQFPAGETSP